MKSLKEEMDKLSKANEETSKQLEATRKQLEEVSEQLSTLQIEKAIEYHSLEKEMHMHRSEKCQLQTKILSVKTSVSLVSGVMKEFRNIMDNITQGKDSMHNIPTGSKRTYEQAELNKVECEKISSAASSSKTGSSTSKTGGSTSSKTGGSSSKTGSSKK